MRAFPIDSKHKKLLIIPIVALVYIVGAKLGLSLAFSHSSVSPVWPPSGIAIGFTLLCGPRVLWGVFIGALFANSYFTPTNFLISMAIASGNTLEALTAFLLVRRFVPDILYFDRLKSVLLFVILGGGVATLVSAFIGTSTLCLGGSAEWSLFPILFRTWWVGDAGGALLVTPLVIGLNAFLKHEWKVKEVLEFALLIVAVFLATETSFGNTAYLDYFREKLPLGFLNIPIFIWAAYRFRQLGITILLGLQAVITIRGTLAGSGPFWREDPNDSLIIVQLFLVSRAIAFHFLACVISELREFRFISDNALESHYLIDPEGKILYTNNIARKRLNYSQKELEGLSIQNVCPDLTPESINRLLSSPIASQANSPIEVTHIRKDGSTYPAEATITAIGTNGQSRAFYVGRDITLRKEVENELSKKAEQLSRLNSELETFTSMVSHDLKSPLRNISNLAQVIYNKLQEKWDQEDKKLFELIFDSCSRMNRLIKDLLTTAQIGRQASEPEQIDMMDVLSSVLRGLDSQIRDTNSRVTTDPLPVVWGRKTELEVVLQNLLVNALKYRSAEPPRIHISAKPEEQGWVFSVSDNGIGLPEDAREKIFHPFVRMRTETQREGTGLGLSMCKKVIESLGGKIWCESKLGKGSVFFFLLPNDKHSAFSSVPRAVPVTTVAEKTAVPPRILIIDDSPSDSNVMEVLLKKESETAQIVVAKDGEKALAYLQRTPTWALPSIILLDVSLPRMDGFTVLKEIKTNEVLKSIPVIMLTTTENPEEIKKAYENSASCFLKKPRDLNGYRRMVNLVQQFWFECARLPLREQ